MRPVHEFLENSSQTAPATASQPDPVAVGHIFHEADSSVRNLCLVWEDGRRAFFNYSYLQSVDLVLTDRLNVMLLYFSGQIVTLKGYNLGLLFDLLLDHVPKTIVAINPRYRIDDEKPLAFVIEIFVKIE